jgi:hypothetical protein
MTFGNLPGHLHRTRKLTRADRRLVHRDCDVAQHHLGLGQVVPAPAVAASTVVRAQTRNARIAEAPIAPSDTTIARENRADARTGPTGSAEATASMVSATARPGTGRSVRSARAVTRTAATASIDARRRSATASVENATRRAARRRRQLLSLLMTVMGLLAKTLGAARHHRVTQHPSDGDQRMMYVIPFRRFLTVLTCGAARRS